MLSHKLKSFLAIPLLALLPSQLDSAEILWGDPQTVTDDSDISTNGTLVEAVNASSQPPPFASPTVNGVTFLGGSLLRQSNFGGDFDPDGGSELGETYGQLMSDADFGNGRDTTISIATAKLFVGAQYEVQVWFLDKRPSTDRVMTFSGGDGDATSVDLDGRIGQYAIGTFIADEKAQTLRLRTNGFGNAHINAYQVRLLTPVSQVTTLVDEFDTPSGDELSLREAIRDAGSGDLITFASNLDGGTIQLDASLGQLVINKALIIDASALPKGIIIDGGSNGDLVKNSNETRCVLISNGAGNELLAVRLNRLTIQNGISENDTGLFEGDLSGANIHNQEDLTMIDCQILQGRAFGGEFGTPGGGIFNSGNITLTGCTVAGNQTQGSQAPGGGLLNLFGDLTMVDCTISGNCTQGVAASGGGIFNSNGDVTLTGCTVSGNQTQGQFAPGGGIRNDEGDLTLTHCTITENTAENAVGGGIATTDTQSKIQHCTIVGNTSNVGGSGIANNDANSGTNTEISFSIVQGNLGSTDIALADNLTTNFFVFTGQNLVGTVGAGIDNAPTSPQQPLLLAPLANYGGPTETMPPLPGNPAVNGATGSDAEVDQRGFEISDGLPDIGAVEFQGIADEVFLSDEIINADFDNDGLSVALELAIGTDPFVTDFDNPNRPSVAVVNGKPTLTFGAGSLPQALSDFGSFFEIIIERSETLEASSFEEVGIIEIFDEGGPTVTSEERDDIVINVIGDQVSIRDDSTDPRAFYRISIFIF